MNRREEREHKFKLLFCTQFYNGDEVPAQLEQYFESPDYDDGDITIRMDDVSEKDEKVLMDEVEKIVEKIPELDEKISASSDSWRLDRMSKTDLTVLRLALYELNYSEDIPEKVSINEAVELAKKYGGPESGAFVNGILGRLASINKDRQVKTKKTTTKTAQSRKGQITEKTGEDNKRVHILINKSDKDKE